jgi:hypothetical protein
MLALPNSGESFMQLSKWLIVPACYALVSFSTLAQAETYRFAEGQSSMAAAHSGAHTKAQSAHAGKKHSSQHHHHTSQSDKALYGHP